MTNDDKQKQENEDILEQMEDELEEIQDEEGQIDTEKLEDAVEGKVLTETTENEEGTYKDRLLKLQADFDNYKKRTERDKEDMTFFLKADILGRILPRIDDLERIIKNTPKDLKQNPLFEGIISVLAKLTTDLERMGVKAFNSIGEEVDPDKHEVMTVVPGKEAGIIFDEFEKGYLLGDRVLRHAKVIVGEGE